MITRGELLSLNETRTMTVELPTHDAAVVTIRNMTSGQRRRFRNSLTDAEGEMIPARSSRIDELLICHCLIDDSGQPMFTDDDAMNDVLDDLDGAVIACLAYHCRRWTGFAVDDDFQAIRAAVKNSTNGQAKSAPV